MQDGERTSGESVHLALGASFIFLILSYASACCCIPGAVKASGASPLKFNRLISVKCVEALRRTKQIHEKDDETKRPFANEEIAPLQHRENLSGSPVCETESLSLKQSIRSQHVFQRDAEQQSPRSPLNKVSTKSITKAFKKCEKKDEPKTKGKLNKRTGKRRYKDPSKRSHAKHQSKNVIDKQGRSTSFSSKGKLSWGNKVFQTSEIQLLT